MALCKIWIPLTMLSWRFRLCFAFCSSNCRLSVEIQFVLILQIRRSWWETHCCCVFNQLYKWECDITPVFQRQRLLRPGNILEQGCAKAAHLLLLLLRVSQGTSGSTDNARVQETGPWNYQWIYKKLGCNLFFYLSSAEVCCCCKDVPVPFSLLSTS